MPPILFLDIDGVLNVAVGRRVLRSHTGRLRFQTIREFSADAVARLNALCERSGALLVVSSSWRLQGDVRPVLAEHRVTGALHDDWATDDEDDDRGAQIERWLIAHDRPAYVVLDDDAAPLQQHADNLVTTDWTAGLQDSDVERALMVLGGGTITVLEAQAVPLAAVEGSS